MISPDPFIYGKVLTIGHRKAQARDATSNIIRRALVNVKAAMSVKVFILQMDLIKK